MMLAQQQAPPPRTIQIPLKESMLFNIYTRTPEMRKRLIRDVGLFDHASRVPSLRSICMEAIVVAHVRRQRVRFMKRWPKRAVAKIRRVDPLLIESMDKTLHRCRGYDSGYYEPDRFINKNPVCYVLPHITAYPTFNVLRRKRLRGEHAIRGPEHLPPEKQCVNCWMEDPAPSVLAAL